jgi:thioredoxin
MSKIIEVTDDRTFEAEVFGSQVPVLVDFYATYCSPCRLLRPVLTALADNLGDTVKIVAVDVVANEGLVQAHQIAAVPTLIVFKSGVEVHRLVGLKDLHQLREALAA